MWLPTLSTRSAAPCGGFVPNEACPLGLALDTFRFSHLVPWGSRLCCLWYLRRRGAVSISFSGTGLLRVRHLSGLVAFTSLVAWTGNFGSCEPRPLACVGSEKPRRLPVCSARSCAVSSDCSEWSRVMYHRFFWGQYFFGLFFKGQLQAFNICLSRPLWVRHW